VHGASAAGLRRSVIFIDLVAAALLGGATGKSIAALLID